LKKQQHRFKFASFRFVSSSNYRNIVSNGAGRHNYASLF